MTHWFRRKLYGYGWFPNTWQGWFVVAGHVLVIFLLALRVQPSWTGAQLTWQLFTPLILLVISLIVICVKKGPKPRWQWGKQLED